MKFYDARSRAAVAHLLRGAGVDAKRLEAQDADGNAYVETGTSAAVVAFAEAARERQKRES